MIYGTPTKDIRKNIHRHPELSGDESKTATLIRDLLRRVDGMKIHTDIGGHGLVAVKKYGEGSTIAFRAELDGLPIQEERSSDYRSEWEGKSHACGHDGHMCILLELLEKLESAKTASGSLVLIFQPAEETGKGAMGMIDTDFFEGLSIDFCYALHNIPGLPKSEVFAKEISFACASAGMRLEITGKTAHAAHPEDARNPLLAAAKALQMISKLPEDESISGFTLATSIALQSGDENYGTSPEKALLLMTLRAAANTDLHVMMEKVKDIASQIASEDGVECGLSFHEYFPATENDAHLKHLEHACNGADIPFHLLEKPFRWSEDFGHFSKCFPTAMFGLGSGKDCPPLHASTYDFPDELIDTGSAVFLELFKHHNP